MVSGIRYLLIMKRILALAAVLSCLPVWGQPGGLPETGRLMGNVYHAAEFRRIADSMRMAVGELSGYPVIFPVKQSVVSSPFGMRLHPIYRVRKFHTGIDIAKARGTPVYATGNGVVVRRGYDSGYGNYVEIEHSGGFRSFYAHLSEVAVRRGDTVKIATPIARVGDTGTATGSHLHYEVRKNGRFLNPRDWCYCLSELLKTTPIAR